MYKISVAGIDNSGKTSVVRSLENTDGIGAIYTFGEYVGSKSRLARFFGSLVDRLTQFDQENGHKTISGFAWVGHFIPYYFAERANRHKDIVARDRDPVVDALCYSESYLLWGTSRILRRPLKLTLKTFFGYPNLLIYLETSPEVAVQRSVKKKQLHEDSDNLTRVRDLYDQEIFRLEREGIDVVRINTDTKSLEEVIEEVRHTLVTNGIIV